MEDQVKKVLVIDKRQGGDWALDLLFAGLCQNIGTENVIDFPSHRKHRLGENFRVGNPEKDWGLERQSLGYTPDWKKLQDCGATEVMKMVRSGEIDTVFVDETDECFLIYASLGLKTSNVKTVVVAGHDKFWNLSPQRVRQMYGNNFKTMFLSNWKKEYEQFPWARVYDWSINFDHLWNRTAFVEKKYDVCFLGYNSHDNRSRYVDHMLDKWGHSNNKFLFERRPNVTDVFMNKQEYFETMASSKICLNLRGAAEDGKTLRFFEIPYVGSFMLSEWTDSWKNMRLPPNIPAFYDEKSLDALVEFYLKKSEERELQASETHHKFITNHTSKARVAWMLGEISG